VVCNISCERQTSLPRYQRQTTRAFAVTTKETRRFGSFVTGILAEANVREMMSLMAWCLVIRLGAILHTKAWRPHVSTCDPHRQVCAAQRPRPSRKATATRTASSSRRRPHEAIGSANSQSLLCLAAAAKRAAFCHGSLLLLLTESRAAWRPGLPPANCL